MTLPLRKRLELPKIYDALEAFKTDGTRVVLEVQAHVGESSVRAISMDSTDGFTRGMEAASTGTSNQECPQERKLKDDCLTLSERQLTESTRWIIQRRTANPQGGTESSRTFLPLQKSYSQE